MNGYADDADRTDERGFLKLRCAAIFLGADYADYADLFLDHV